MVVEAGGITRVMFGAYDRAVHFLDGATGQRFLPDLPTGDIIKGSVMVDPDGYPLLYTGRATTTIAWSRLDREKPAVLWKINATDVPNPVWNNDWDSSGVVVGDYLFEGGENSYFFIIRLNRGYTSEGKVTVDPQVVLAYAAYDQKLFEYHRRPAREHRELTGGAPGSRTGRPGLLRQWRRPCSGPRHQRPGALAAGYGPAGQAPGTWENGVTPTRPLGSWCGRWPRVRRVPPAPADPTFPVAFKYWAGDDIDASVVIDEEGMLYVGVELERMLPRAKEVGQLIKLDPYREGDPLLWSVADPAKGGTGGIWATPALHGDMVYVTTHTGRLLGVDRGSGADRWEKPFTYHAWSSSVVVDDTLIVGDTDGWLHAYDVSRAGEDPPELWKVRTGGGGAVESTPAVWKGRIYVGSRDGYFYCFGDG